MRVGPGWAGKCVGSSSAPPRDHQLGPVSLRCKQYETCSRPRPSGSVEREVALFQFGCDCSRAYRIRCCFSAASLASSSFANHFRRRHIAGSPDCQFGAALSGVFRPLLTGLDAIASRDQSPIRSRSSHWRNSPLKPMLSRNLEARDEAPLDLLAGLSGSCTASLSANRLESESLTTPTLSNIPLILRHVIRKACFGYTVL